MVPVDRNINTLFELLLCIKLVCNFLVNNYEISEFEAVYLNIWSENREKPYIFVGSLLHYLTCEDMPIFHSYFQPYEGRVTMSMYIEFVCLFSFFSNKQLIPLLLSLCNIFSNKVISELQIYNFFHAIHIDNETLLCVPTLLLKEVKRDQNNLISLSSFCKFLTTNEEFLKPLIFVRNAIIEKIITKETYDRIIKRKKYYVDQVKQQKIAGESLVLLKYPRESCLKRMIRVLFIDKPYEYYYDYISPDFIKDITDNYYYNSNNNYNYNSRNSNNSNISNNNNNNNNINNTNFTNNDEHIFDEYITVIRKQYGYSNRHNSRSRSQLGKSNNRILRESSSYTNTSKSHLSRLAFEKEREKFIDRSSLINVITDNNNNNNIPTISSPAKYSHSIFSSPLNA